MALLYYDANTYMQYKWLLALNMHCTILDMYVVCSMLYICVCIICLLVLLGIDFANISGYFIRYLCVLKAFHQIC